MQSSRSESMSAIEFQTTIKDSTITIPEEYRSKIKGTVRVILLTESTQSFDMIDHLLANPLRVVGFEPLSRNEIYERP
jgi:hypothetical protein